MEEQERLLTVNEFAKLTDKSRQAVYQQMSNNLWSEKNRISMTEYKILDIYMGAINSHDINTKEVLIDAKHLKELLGTTYTVSDLRVIFLKLLSLSVRVTDKILISLFSKAEIIENENFELQVICA